MENNIKVISNIPDRQIEDCYIEVFENLKAKLADIDEGLEKCMSIFSPCYWEGGYFTDIFVGKEGVSGDIEEAARSLMRTVNKVFNGEFSLVSIVSMRINGEDDVVKLLCMDKEYDWDPDTYVSININSGEVLFAPNGIEESQISSLVEGVQKLWGMMSAPKEINSLDIFKSDYEKTCIGYLNEIPNYWYEELEYNFYKDHDDEWCDNHVVGEDGLSIAISGKF